MTNATIEAVTERIRARSAKRRRRYLDLIDAYDASVPARAKVAEPNQAHNSAGCALHEKTELLGGKWPAIGVITAYNDHNIVRSVRCPLGPTKQSKQCYKGYN